MLEYNNMFYSGLEDGVREYVRHLRNIGINTECSCHHEGYIQCQVLDPTEELRKLKTLFMVIGLTDYEIKFTSKQIDRCHFDLMMITSPKFKQQR